MNSQLQPINLRHGSKPFLSKVVLGLFLLPVSHQQFEGEFGPPKVFKTELFLNRDELTNGLYEGDVIGRKLFGDSQVPHGFGTIYYYSTDKFQRLNYTGQWNNGAREGNGTTYFRDGALYRGEYKQGMEHGTGFILYPNENTLDAEFRNGKIHGHGVFRYRNGDQREGFFKDNILDGQVIFTRLTGDTVIETWLNGKKIEEDQSQPKPLVNIAGGGNSLKVKADESDNERSKKSRKSLKKGVNFNKLRQAIREGDKSSQFGRAAKSQGRLSEDDIRKLGDDARNQRKNWSLAIFRLVNN